MLMNDAYAGHRKWWNPDWEEDPALVSVYTEWDFILVRVYQYMQDYMTDHGHPIWVEEDPDVEWEFEKRTSYLKRELHLFTESNELKEWEFPVAKPHWEDGHQPTMQRWVERMEAEAEGRDTDKPTRGRPPTVEELAAMQANGENR